jgi:hypothetical protein
MKIEKGEDSAFISEAADQLTLFGGPVKFKKFDESPALEAVNTTWFPQHHLHLLRMRRNVHEVPPLRICLLIPHQIPHPSVPPLFHQDRFILNI